MKLFLDSGAFIARARRKDPYHRVASETFAAISRGDLSYRMQYTSNYVVDETITFLLYESGARVAVEVLRRIRSSPTLRILHVTEEVEFEADRAFERFSTSRVSYTDCTTKALVERESIDAVFSFDRDIAVLGLTRIP